LRSSSKDWDQDIYKKGQQINRYPFDALVTFFLRNYSRESRARLRVLEIGCGTGNNINFLLQEGFNAIGVDSSQTAVDLGNRFLVESGHKRCLKRAELSKLDFENESFDIVLDRGCLTQNSLADIKVILGEAKRILVDGGIVLSYTLFGNRHPEIDFGKEVSPNCRDFFISGYFSNVGLTSFHDIQSIKECFEMFQILEIKKQNEFLVGSEESLINETYSVVALKKDT